MNDMKNLFAQFSDEYKAEQNKLKGTIIMYDNVRRRKEDEGKKTSKRITIRQLMKSVEYDKYGKVYIVNKSTGKIGLLSFDARRLNKMISIHPNSLYISALDKKHAFKKLAKNGYKFN